MDNQNQGCTLTEFEVRSEPGNERVAMGRVGRIAEWLGISALRCEQLEFAVGEAVLNAIEHGNESRADVPVRVAVALRPGALAVRVTDQGKGRAFGEPTSPDLDQKLAGLQSPRGWGLFLMKQLVDEVRIAEAENGHTVALILHLRADQGPDGVLKHSIGGIMVPSKVTMKARQAGVQTSVIDITGEVSAFAEDELMMAYGDAVTDGAQTMVLNFSDVSYINSSGIGLLVTLLIRANRNGHKLLAYGLGDHYRRIFELTRLNEAIGVYSDEAAALAAAI